MSTRAVKLNPNQLPKNKLYFSGWLIEMPKVSIHGQRLCTRPCFVHVCGRAKIRLDETQIEVKLWKVFFKINCQKVTRKHEILYLKGTSGNISPKVGMVPIFDYPPSMTLKPSPRPKKAFQNHMIISNKTPFSVSSWFSVHQVYWLSKLKL